MALAIQMEKNHKKKIKQRTLSGEVQKKDDVDKRNYLNELTNTEWMFFTRSVWNTTYQHILSHNLRKKQGGNKPPGLMKDLIVFFTKSNEKVLDPMVGVGGALLGCELTGRDGIGIELNEEWVDIYHQVCKKNGLKPFPVIVGDCLEKIDEIVDESIHFCIMDPPYRENTKWNRTMCDFSHKTRDPGITERYSNHEKDFGNIMDAEKFLEKIIEISSKVHDKLISGKYFVVFCKDEYQDEEYREKSSIFAEAIRSAGFQWKGKITWFQSGAKLRPYGVPYSYVPNLMDQKILVFRKK